MRFLTSFLLFAFTLGVLAAPSPDSTHRLEHRKPYHRCNIARGPYHLNGKMATQNGQGISILHQKDVYKSSSDTDLMWTEHNTDGHQYVVSNLSRDQTYVLYVQYHEVLTGHTAVKQYYMVPGATCSFLDATVEVKILVLDSHHVVECSIKDKECKKEHEQQ